MQKDKKPSPTTRSSERLRRACRNACGGNIKDFRSCQLSYIVSNTLTELQSNRGARNIEFVGSGDVGLDAVREQQIIGDGTAERPIDKNEVGEMTDQLPFVGNTNGRRG